MQMDRSADLSGGSNAVLARAQQFDRMAGENRARGGGGKERQYHRQQPQSQQQQQQQQQARPQQQMSQPDSPQPQPQPQQNQAIVTPELLVDALSGHEDGLLAIAEKLMEHYDSGYDAMGEAIIDAFADVQKLFQHVVEAAHMEGAAFEASRREEEMERLKEAAGEHGMADALDGAHAENGMLDAGEGDNNDYGPSRKRSPEKKGGNTNPSRHDEYIDQDVKDILNDAIRKARPLRDAENHDECYGLYEKACNSASALLPVDSDHRGRLQLSIARAESMSADRACAILKYAMDDVLRSGLGMNGFGGGPAHGGIDPSKRGDCVLPARGLSASDGDAAAQSADEALASLVEEMKEVLSAPVYDNSPVQVVANRFWEALGEAQRSNVKTEERLEQKLASLKAEYLLAREEWEERLGMVKRENDALRLKYNRVLKDSDEGNHYMEEARKIAANGSGFDDADSHRGSGTNGSAFDRTYLSKNSSFGGDASVMSGRGGRRNTTASVASFGSGLAQHARGLVGALSCVGPGGDRYGPDANLSSVRRRSRSRGRDDSRGRSNRDI